MLDIARYRTRNLQSMIPTCSLNAICKHDCVHTGGDGIMGGPTENPFGIDLLNLQLGLVDRDFDESDYEVGASASIDWHPWCSALLRCSLPMELMVAETLQRAVLGTLQRAVSAADVDACQQGC